MLRCFIAVVGTVLVCCVVVVPSYGSVAIGGSPGQCTLAGDPIAGDTLYSFSFWDLSGNYPLLYGAGNISIIDDVALAGSGSAWGVTTGSTSFMLATGAGYSPSGQFLYDNVAYPSNSAPDQLDSTAGLLLVTPSGIEINIWSNDSESNWGGTPGFYSLWTWVPGSDYVVQDGDVHFSITAIPEPVSLIIWSLFGLGSAFGLHVWRRRGIAVPATPTRQPWSDESRMAIHQMIERGYRR
jgi:hypothetical protein